jgi:hypothetical protein
MEVSLLFTRRSKLMHGDITHVIDIMEFMENEL